MECEDKVSVGSPVIINSSKGIITRPYKFPNLASEDIKSPNFFGARVFKGILYYIVVEERKASLVKNGFYKIPIGEPPMNILSTSMAIFGDDLIIMYNRMLHRIDSVGNVIVSQQINNTRGILITTASKIILITSVCNNIIVFTYNITLTNIGSKRITTDYEINLSAATEYLDSYLVTTFYISEGRMYSLLIKISDNFTYAVQPKSDIFYNDIFALDEFYYILARTRDELYLYKYDVENALVGYYRRNITLSSFNEANSLFYGGVVGNRVYITYNNFENNIPNSMVSMFSKNLNYLWSIKLNNASINSNGRSVGISTDRVYMAIITQGEVLYNDTLILGNFLIFDLLFPKLIGICVTRNCNIAQINFRDPDNFGMTLKPGQQYYINSSGKITTTELNNRYLGTAVTFTKMLIN